MSKVFSFRLNEDSPREAQAREVIEVWVGEGYSLRHVITEALLTLQNGGDNQPDINLVLKQLREIIWGLKDNQGELVVAQKEVTVLPNGFVSAIKKSARSGISTQ